MPRWTIAFVCFLFLFLGFLLFGALRLSKTAPMAADEPTSETAAAGRKEPPTFNAHGDAPSSNPKRATDGNEYANGNSAKDAVGDSKFQTKQGEDPKTFSHRGETGGALAGALAGGGAGALAGAAVGEGDEIKAGFGPPYPAHHKGVTTAAGPAKQANMDSKEAKISNATGTQHPVAPPPVTDDDAMENAFAKLKEGNLVYKTPEKMSTSETASVTARIGTKDVAPALMMQDMNTARDTTVVTTTTPVTTKMRMTLASADFTITKLSSEEQSVGGDMPTTWSWQIKPLHAGHAHLHLAAIVEVKDLNRDFAVLDRDITVQIDAVDEAEQFVKDNTVWVLGGTGSGCAAVFAWLKRRNKKKELAKG